MSDTQGYPAPAQAQHPQQMSPGSQQHPMLAHRHTQDDSAYPHEHEYQGPSPNPLMRLQNYSVPSLPSQGHPNGQHEPMPPMPPPYEQYDPNDILSGFNDLRVSDPSAHGAGPLAYHNGDPVPRAGTSMSMRSAMSVHTQQRMGHPGMPVSPDHAMRRMPPGRPNGYDASSVHSGGSGGSAYNSVYSDTRDSGAYDGSGETDGTSLYSYEDSVYQQQPSPNGYHMDGAGPYPPRGYPPPNWQGQQPGYPMHAPPPPQNQFNSLYAAASDVLGMGPPPGPPQPSPSPYHPPPPGSHAPSPVSYHPPPPGPGPMPPQQYYAQNGPPPIPANQSATYLGPGAYQPPAPPPSMYPASSQTSLVRGPPQPPEMQEEEVEFRNRPSLQRSGTTASVNLRTQKTKAIDLSAPPFTKEYIDQYRQRIKDDPDPESHFLYAKYLIEAAKRFGADAKDQRGVKKFRDALIQESLKVMRRLATQGQAYDEAQFFLANCHGTGMLGLPVDHERAYHLYLQAAKQNHAAACYRVAVCNEIGAGTRREPQRALAFYRKSASLGDTAAMYKLGVILIRGLLGEQPNLRDAVGWLKRAAEQADEENPHALHELALLYENPQNGVVPYDPAYAKELYTRAGHLGYTHSQYRLGQCHEYGNLTCPVDPRRSIGWYTKAAEKGHSEAELALSGWYLTGSDGVLKQSDSEAYLWARRAANKGLSKAEYAVGYYAEVGIGIKQDIEFAKRWYMRAAAQGNKRAMNRLTEMKRNGNKRANMARPTRQDAKDECVIV